MAASRGGLCKRGGRLWELRAENVETMDRTGKVVPVFRELQLGGLTMRPMVVCVTYGHSESVCPIQPLVRFLSVALIRPEA